MVRVFLPLSETEDTELEVISIFGIGILGSFSFLNFGAGNFDPASIFIFGAFSSLKISNFGGAGRFRGSFFTRVFVVEFSLRVRVLEVDDFDLQTKNEIYSFNQKVNSSQAFLLKIDKNKTKYLKGHLVRMLVFVWTGDSGF